MLYKKPKFSVPATEGKGDCSQGHAMPDRKGKCIRCGDSVSERARQLATATSGIDAPFEGEDGG